MMIKDKNGNVIDANEQYCKLFDISLKELLKINVNDLIDLSKDQNFNSKNEKVLEGITLEYTVPVIRKDANVSYIRLYEKRIQLPNKDSGVLVVAYDETKKKLKMEEVKEREKLLEAFFDKSLDGFYIMLLDEPVQWKTKIIPKFFVL